MNLTNDLNMNPVSGPIYSLNDKQKDYIYYANALVAELTAGEYIEKDKVVSLNSQGKIVKANIADGSDVVGIALQDIEDNEKGIIQSRGEVFIKNMAFPPGSKLYLHDGGLIGSIQSDIYLGTVVKLEHIELDIMVLSEDISGQYVPITRTVNHKSLENDIAITPDDMSDGSTNKFWKDNIIVDLGEFG